MFLGIMVFVTVIPSCAARSSSKFDALVNVGNTEQESAVSDSKSLKTIIDNLPSAEEIRAMPLAAHPRLLAFEERFAEIKKQIKTDKTMKQWYKKLHRYAENMLQQEVPVYELPDGKRLFTKNKNKSLERRVTTLAFLYRIEKDKRYLNRIWQDLGAITKFPDWNPSHFLDTARMTYITAIGYDWLYEDWSDWQHDILRSAILEKGLKPALDDYQTGARWTRVENNWNQVCNSGIGIGSLAVIDQYPELASETLYEALKRLPDAMQHYAPDGAWDEGPSYWKFGTIYNTLILDALDSSLGNDFGLSDIPGFAQTGFFPIYMSGTFGLPFNFSDASDNRIRASELFWMSDKFAIKSYADYQQKVAAPLPLDFIWYNPSWGKMKPEQLPLDKYFRDTEVVSMRSEWENPKGIFVGFKAGNNSTNHGHLDLGTFVVDALGVRWAIELGKDDYNLPGYFDKKYRRWTYYRMRAEGQNTLVINPDSSPDQNPNAKTKITRFNSKPNRVYAVSNLTPAYADIRKISRGISLENKRQQILIQDEIQTDTPIDLWWFMHTEADIEISKDGKTAMLYQDGARLWAKLLNPKANYRFSVMNAQPLPSSPNPKGQGKNTGIKKLTVRLKDIKNERLTVLLVPLRKGENLPRKMPKVKNISKW